MLTQELTIQQRKELLETLFGFDLINVNYYRKEEHWVIYNEEGEEFYGRDENLKFDFSTLEGFFAYATHRAKNQGYSDCQYAIRKILDI